MSKFIYSTTGKPHYADGLTVRRRLNVGAVGVQHEVGHPSKQPSAYPGKADGSRRHKTCRRRTKGRRDGKNKYVQLRRYADGKAVGVHVYFQFV